MRSTFPRPRVRKRWCGISTARTSTSIPDRIRPSGCGRCRPKASRSPTSTSIGGRPTRASRRITWSSPRSSGGRRSMDPALEEAAVCFAAFDVPAVLGLTNRIYTFSTYVFRQLTPTEGLPEYGEVATLSVIMVVFAVALSWCYRRVQRQAPRYAVVTGKAYRPRIVPLGRAKWPTVGCVAAFFLASQVLPLSMLCWVSGLPFLQPPSVEALADLSLDNFRAIPTELLLRSMENTGILMIVVPTITVALSVAVSWVVLRSKAPARGLFDFFAFLPVTIPPIVFSVAALLLALFVLGRIVPIYGSIWILILVYVVARLSYGTRMTNSAMIQIHKELDEAAQVSGAGTARVLR